MKCTQMYTLVSSNLRFQGNSVDADLEIVSMGNQHIDDVSAAAGGHIPLRSVAPAVESVVRSLVAKEKNKNASAIYLVFICISLHRIANIRYLFGVIKILRL